MMKWALLGAAAAAISCSNVAAQSETLTFKDGNSLYRDCTSESSVLQAACGGYIIGVSDSHQAIFSALDASPSYCLRTGVNVTQLKDVVVQFLQRNPQLRDYSAPTVIIPALQEAFPCPTK
jgi:hypothetical protein